MQVVNCYNKVLYIVKTLLIIFTLIVDKDFHICYNDIIKIKGDFEMGRKQKRYIYNSNGLKQNNLLGEKTCVKCGNFFFNEVEIETQEGEKCGYCYKQEIAGIKQISLFNIV